MIRWYHEGAEQGQSDRGTPVWLHLLLGSWVAVMLWQGRASSVWYSAFMQEDRAVEWGTAFAFALAGVAFFVLSVAGKRWGDGAVALFCFVAAGEEISWGQRLLGYLPSETFLERNAQQEANLHNLVEAFGQPKWSLIAVVAGYGLLLPVLARHARMARMLHRLRIAIVPWSLACWFAAAVMILIWYPVRFTGEWVEAMVGVLFLAAAPLTAPVTAGLLALTTLAAFGAEHGSRRAAANPEQLVCAAREAAALATDVRADTLSRTMQRDGRVHKRVYTLWRDGDLTQPLAQRFRSVWCDESPSRLARRRRFAIDPWGTAYWLRAERGDDGSRRVSVYSFGPNRRRDLDDQSGHDDVVAR